MECLGTGENTQILLFEKGGKKFLGELQFDYNSGGFTRGLDSTSTFNFSATLGGVGREICCDIYENLYQWGTEVHVIRDGYTAWIGPVIEVLFSYGRVDVTAADLSAWWDRRVLPDLNFQDLDLADIFVAMHEAAMEPDLTPCVEISARQSGIRGDREVLGGDCRLASDELAELARTGVDWTAYGRTIEVGGRDLGEDRRQIVLAEDDFANPPAIRARGNDQATKVIVKGAEGIIAMAQDDDYIDYYGLLVRVFDESQFILDQDSANEAANTRLDLLKDPVFLEGNFSALKPSAQVCSWELLPGTEVLLQDSSLCRPFSTSFRLSGAQFNLSGEVSISLENAGTYGSEIVS